MRTPLQPLEKILLRTNTSWVTLVLPAVGILVAIAVGILSKNWTVGLIVFCVATAYFGWKYLEWKHNIWVVTNFRVIDEFGVLNINSKESPLDKINNVSYNQTIWGRIFGFGNVEIQTAATIGETIYESVDHPKTLKETITQAQANYKHEHIGQQTRQIINEIQSVKPVSSLPLEPSLQRNNITMEKPVEKASQDGPLPSQPISASQIATQIEKLIALKQQGVLTEEEYQRAKARLLGS